MKLFIGSTLILLGLILGATIGLMSINGYIASNTSGPIDSAWCGLDTNNACDIWARTRLTNSSTIPVGDNYGLQITGGNPQEAGRNEY